MLWPLATQHKNDLKPPPNQLKVGCNLFKTYSTLGDLQPWQCTCPFRKTRLGKTPPFIDHHKAEM